MGQAETMAIVINQSNQIASFETPVILSVVTVDIENLHFDIDTCINKHSGMIRDQNWRGVTDL